MEWSDEDWEAMQDSLESGVEWIILVKPLALAYNKVWMNIQVYDPNADKFVIERREWLKVAQDDSGDHILLKVGKDV